MIFAEIISNKYDIAVANPPYTDSGSYGGKLKNFIIKNYKKPLSFYSNLYAVFLKRCSELISKNGKIGMIHPLTFMYIKSYEDMRKFILDKFHINIFVEYGLSDLFGSIMVDPAFYILEKNSYKNETLFISMNQYTRTPEENFKEEYTKNALKNYIEEKNDKNLYLLDQSKLKIIESCPFVYWISDDFREKFKEESIEALVKVCTGLSTAKNIRFLRYWWEILKEMNCKNYINKKWIPYAKGGVFCKWFGNNLLFIDWDKDGDILKQNGATIRNRQFYFYEGITSTGRSSIKGTSFKLLPKNYIFDVGSTGLIMIQNEYLEYCLGLLNSKLITFTLNCFNPTVNTTEGDLKRIPFIYPNESIKKYISSLSRRNIELKEKICEFNLVEMNYKYNPILWAKEKCEFSDLRKLIKVYLDYENELLAQAYLNEASIDELIFQVYQVTEEDKQMILEKEGIPVGNLPLFEDHQFVSDQILPEVKNYIKTIETKVIDSEEKEQIIKIILRLYQQSISLEEICKKVQINPLSIIQIIKESQSLPEKRSQEIAQDLLFDLVREILEEDKDGIIPLVKYSGEDTLQDLLYPKMINKGFTHTKIDNFKDILGCGINTYLEKYFFQDLTNRLNLFMYLPKTPFIWHLSSGGNQGFEAFISIYKWSRDKLFRLRSVYIEKRESSLKNRFSDLSKDISLKVQKEKDLIIKQLKEIDIFKKKIDEILKSGYNPKLDDGVGKNIAPLQEKGLLKHDVLKKKELQKYLNADW